MKAKMSKFLALLLAMAMVLPMALPAFPVAATEVTEETEATEPATEATDIPTETVPVGSAAEEEEKTPVFAQLNFSDETDLANFDLYQSGTSKFVVTDGVLAPDGTDGEQKAIFNKDVSRIESVSVNIIPGASGNIYAGVYVGANDPADEQDSINSMAFLIKSDYSGWSDAPNRIDIIQGQFNGSWKHIKTVISETGNGNNLFSGGTKQPLNLKLTFSEDVILLKLSLVSNPDKYVQVMYEVEPEELQGSVGLRTIGSDTCFDKFTVNENYVPSTLTEGLKLDGTGLDSYGKSTDVLTEKPATIEAWFKMESFSNGTRRQAIISNYVGGGLASQKAGSWGVYTNEYGTLYYTEKSAAGEFNKTVGVKVWTNEWTHLTLVRGAGVLKVYINGELANTIESDKIGETTSLENYLTIGYCCVGGSTGINSLKGEIGDIRLWNTERTQAQIQADMYRELEGTEEGLIQHWNFDSQEKGIVSNTVEGGLDVELLGHTQIGNEEIRRWDFSQESQLEDFSFYYAPTYTSETYNYAFNITDEKLFISGSINNSSTDVKAILKEKIDNITYMGADVTQGSTSTANVSMLFGIKSINSANVNDYEGFQVPMTRQRTSAAKRPYSEVWFNKISNGSATAVTGTSTNTTFFPGADVKLPFHIELTFTGNEVDAFMYRLDDPTVTNGQTYTAVDGEMDGQIGLQLKRTSVSFDNYTVVSQIPVEEEPQQDTTIYENEGYNFFNSGSKAWEMKQDITLPYTLEAWVKVPKGIEDSTVGYIVGNPYRAPYLSMQMVANGNLRLAWAVENADLTTSATNFDVDTDLRNGRWTHVAYTCDVANDTVVAYINGKAAKTWTDAGLQDIILPDGVSPANWFVVGSKKTNMGASTNLFPGWIADVRLWDGVLSAQELHNSMMTQYTAAREGLLFNAPLTGIVDDRFEDLSGNDYHLEQSVNGFVLEEQTHEPGAYSMVVIPDQQVLSHYYNAELQGMYQWIADNREKENIQIVMNVGDLADNCGNLTQWENNKAAWELLPDDLPFIAVPGNHDYDTNSGWNKGYGVREQLTLMNQYFPMSIFESYPTEFGALSRDQGVEDNVANTYQAFEVNGNQYLILALEYVPREDAVEWANNVIEAHPNHQVIMITHSYVGSYGNLDRPYLWNDLLKNHENVIMAFSGHVFHTDVVHRTDEGVNGNDVHQMLMDAQNLDTSNRKHAMIGILRFNADGTLCEVSYFSTSRNQYETRSNFTLELPRQEHKYSALVGLNSYETVMEAIANANGEIVKLLKDTDEAITVDADVIIDLAGCTLSNVTVAEGCSLKLIDTAEGGSATVAGTVESIAQVDGKTYEAIGADNVYTVKLYTAELYQQVSLGDDLAMNFVVDADPATKVLVSFNCETTEYDLSELTPDASGRYTVSVKLAAAQMTEEIGLQLVYSGVVAMESSYSIRGYAEAILAGEFDDSTKNLVKAMLHYGAKAQLYFDVNTDDLANTGYELEDSVLPTEYEEMSASGSISGLSFYGASLLFKNKIAVRFYFTGSAEGVSFGDYEAVQKDDMYYVEVAGINPQDYSNLIALTATKGEETLTVSYSPLNYIIRMSEKGSDTLKALVNALYGYHAAAVDYINRADELLANLLNEDTRITRSTVDWTQVDEYTIQANGQNYALDNTATYADSEAIVMLSNSSGAIGTAGLLLRANVTEGKGIKGYLFNINTSSNYIQIYHLNNNYNTDNSDSTLTYLGGVVLNNYSLNAENTEFYVKIEGSTLYVNTVERQQAGTKMLATVDLTKGSTLELYESGYTGILSWVNGVSFDFQLKEFQV